ncbi:hypothetical protein TWF696_001859 [Orbilia brochopaga]|uniref:PARP-type domain-containing protein n=1 Tax=Orbilia brochopaga TaxID=3140254 RepID=A0AAV9U657_9PEZI
MDPFPSPQSSRPNSFIQPLHHPDSLYFIEKSPWGQCECAGCDEFITAGEYRLSVFPGAFGPYSKTHPDVYHIRCFEHKDYALRKDFINRITPLSLSTWTKRGRRDLLTGFHMIPRGLEYLILHYKKQRLKWIEVRENQLAGADTGSTASGGLIDASVNTTPSAQVDGQDAQDSSGCFSSRRYINGWDLYGAFIDNKMEKQHTLWRLVEKWACYEEAVKTETEKLTNDQKEIRAKLGEQGFRAMEELGDDYFFCYLD